MPGRNDPCPCGSGKKYKKCCLAKDVAALPTVSMLPPERPTAAWDGDGLDEEDSFDDVHEYEYEYEDEDEEGEYVHEHDHDGEPCDPHHDCGHDHDLDDESAFDPLPEHDGDEDEDRQDEDPRLNELRLKIDRFYADYDDRGLQGRVELLLETLDDADILNDDRGGDLVAELSDDLYEADEPDAVRRIAEEVRSRRRDLWEDLRFFLISSMLDDAEAVCQRERAAELRLQLAECAGDDLESFLRQIDPLLYAGDAKQALELLHRAAPSVEPIQISYDDDEHDAWSDDDDERLGEVFTFIEFTSALFWCTLLACGAGADFDSSDAIMQELVRGNGSLFARFRTLMRFFQQQSGHVWLPESFQQGLGVPMEEPASDLDEGHADGLPDSASDLIPAPSLGECLTTEFFGWLCRHRRMLPMRAWLATLNLRVFLSGAENEYFRAGPVRKRNRNAGGGSKKPGSATVERLLLPTASRLHRFYDADYESRDFYDYGRVALLECLPAWIDFLVEKELVSAPEAQSTRDRLRPHAEELARFAPGSPLEGLDVQQIWNVWKLRGSPPPMPKDTEDPVEVTHPADTPPAP